MGVKGYKAFQEKEDKINEYTREAHLEDYVERTNEDQEKEAIMRYCLNPEALEKARNVMIADIELYYTFREVIVRNYHLGRLGHHSINIWKFKDIMKTLNGMTSQMRRREWLNKYARKIG